MPKYFQCLAPCLAGLALVLIQIGSAWSVELELPVRTHYGNGELRSEIDWSTDHDDVISRHYDSEGELIEEEWLRSGFSKFQRGGNQCEGNRKNGVVRCEDDAWGGNISYTPYRGYLVHGELKSISQGRIYSSHYKMGKRHGRTMDEYTYGKDTGRRVTHYREGKLHGKQAEYYNGKLRSLLTWKDNEMQGRCIQRHRSVEREGRCNGSLEKFTGVERHFRTDYISRTGKIKKGQDAYRIVRRLERVLHFKDGKQVKEKIFKLKALKSRGKSRDERKAERDRLRDEERSARRAKEIDRLYSQIEWSRFLPAAQDTVQRQTSAKAMDAGLTSKKPLHDLWIMQSAIVQNQALKASGLQKNDIIVGLNGQPFESGHMVGPTDILECLKTANRCTYRLFRKGELLDVEVSVKR